jgi:hypothetical protein
LIPSEIIGMVNFLEEKIVEFSSTKEFRTVKSTVKKKAYAIVNVGIELRHYLLITEHPNEKIVEDALDLINKYYCCIYDSKDRIKKSIFVKPKPEL